MPQCCTDPQCIFTDDFDDGAPLAANFIDSAGNPGGTDCDILAGHGINGTSGLHSDHTSLAGLYAETYLLFPTNLDLCQNPRTEFAVGGYWNFANTNSATEFGFQLIDIRDTRIDVETLIQLATEGPDLVIYGGNNLSSDVLTNIVYRVKNVIAYGTGHFYRIEMRGSIGDTGVSPNNGAWAEVRIDGRTYENGADASQIGPDDPPPDCPTQNSTFGTFGTPLGIVPADWYSAWDKVGIFPQGDFDCLYVKEVAQFCDIQDDHKPHRCPPPGPGGSSFDGSVSGPRTVQPGGFTGWTYSAPPSGGVPATALDPVDPQSLATATDVSYFFKLTLCDGTELAYGQAPSVASNRPFVQPLVQRFGIVEYPLSDRFGNYRGQVWEVDIADPGGTLRGYLDSPTNRFYKRWEGHLYGESDAQRLIGTGVRSAARGRVVSVTSPTDLVIRLTMADEFSRQDSPFTLDRPIPRFTIGELFYIGAPISATGITFLAQTQPTKDGSEPFDNPPENVRGQALPMYYGECSDDFRWAENPPTTPIGICKPYLIGDVLLKNGSERWQMYLASQYALYDITAMFGSNLDPNCPASVRLDLDALTDQFLIPKHGNWSSYFATNYIDVTVGPQAYRMTLFFARGPISQAHVSGDVPISFNCIGIETIGDSLGTPIDDVAYVCQHFLDHPVIQKTLVGNWNAVAAFPDGVAKLRTSSFAQVKAIDDARVSTRYKSRLIIDKQRTAKEWLADILVSGDMRLGVNHHGQLYLTTLDDTQDLTTLTTFTDQQHVRDGSFRITSERSSELENTLSYDWGPEPATGRTTGALKPIAQKYSVLQWGDTYPATEQHFVAVGTQAMADNVGARRLLLTMDGITRGELAVDLAGTAFLPGQLFRVTDFRGLGSSGWSDRVLYIDALLLNPNVSIPPQPDDLGMLVQWTDEHPSLVAPAGMVGGGTTSDGTTTGSFGFAPLGSSVANTGWVMGSSTDGTAWLLRSKTAITGTGGAATPGITVAGSS